MEASQNQLENTRTVKLPKRLAHRIYNKGIVSLRAANIVKAALAGTRNSMPGDVAITLTERDALKWAELINDNSLQVALDFSHRIDEAFVMGVPIPPIEDRRWTVVLEDGVDDGVDEEA